MQVYNATVIDILRSSQRDEIVVNSLLDNIQSFIKLFGKKNYYAARTFIPAVAKFWYHYMTSINNLQTLGEEYAGIIRYKTSHNNFPSKFVQLCWLALYLGGEPLFERLLCSIKSKIKSSKSLTPQAKDILLESLSFIIDNKEMFKRIHLSLFYIHGKYYNISNRSTGIQYILLRQWLQDDTFSSSFNILGKLSLFYLIFSLIQEVRTVRTEHHKENVHVSGTLSSNKLCILCSEKRKNTSVTPCGHIFCWDCIHESLSYQRSCPLCRELVDPSQIVFLQNYA